MSEMSEGLHAILWSRCQYSRSVARGMHATRSRELGKSAVCTAVNIDILVTMTRISVWDFGRASARPIAVALADRLQEEKRVDSER